MKILSIETSCDETAVSIVEASGEINSPSFTVLGNALHSQIATHTEYGGVFPMMAKREHAKNIPHLLVTVLKQAGMHIQTDLKYSEEKWHEIEDILVKEEGLYAAFREVLEGIKQPEIDVIAVTSGPGLVPALWVGISCAKALGLLWNMPVMPVNHMEGHIVSVLLSDSIEEKSISETTKREVEFPALALLISGAHTEIVSIEKWGSYKIMGQTRDDAVGEAFDKVARMLGLPYPGGPEISRLAQKAHEENLPHTITLPRPMIHSDDLDFSFSGLKTAVLYHIRDHGQPNEEEKCKIAREFEDSVVEVLLKKTMRALEETGAKTLIIAGGVISNKKIRETFAELEKTRPGLSVRTPTLLLSTDNSIMIACAGYMHSQKHPEAIMAHPNIIAEGNLKLS